MKAPAHCSVYGDKAEIGSKSYHFVNVLAIFVWDAGIVFVARHLRRWRRLTLSLVLAGARAGNGTAD